MILEADYSSQEMRILGYLASEKNLQDVFFVCPCGESFYPTDNDPERPFLFREHCRETGHEQQDLHTGTASKVFKVDYDKVTKQQRTFAKRVNFGINYGQGATGLAETIGVTVLEAQQLINDYMETFPGIRKFQSRTKYAVENGEKVPNAYGRWRHTFGVLEMRGFIDDKDYKTKRSAMYRQRVNYPVQSAPADIMGNVTIALYDQWGVEREDWQAVEAHVIAKEIFGFHPCIALQKMNAKLLNLVHDSMLWDIDKPVLTEATEIITTCMERLPWEQLDWYLPVDTTVAHRWGGKQ